MYENKEKDFTNINTASIRKLYRSQFGKSEEIHRMELVLALLSHELTQGIATA